MGLNIFKGKSGIPVPGSSDGASDSLSGTDGNPQEQWMFRKFLLLTGGSLLVMMFFFSAFFFLAVRGAEKTVIPSVVEFDLVDALIMLQERELYPRIQEKYTGSPSDKGMVIAQNPEPGLYVKAGRRVTLTVSRGAVADYAEDYTGKTLTEVRSRLASLFSTHEPLLKIREPVSYVYDSAVPGTVLSQTPQAGTPLSEPQDLVLVVSRGVRDVPVTLPDLTDFRAESAMETLSGLSVLFQFTEDTSAVSGSVSRILSQYPLPGTEVAPGSTVQLTFNPPSSVPEGSQYKLFSYTLPDYPVPVLLEVLIREPGSEDRELFSMPHTGGLLSFPYVKPSGSSLLIMINGEETVRILD